tara:strand:- start:976 stop:1821 length:846 start_codon:yes stop_codon:yes gene_type:complete
MADTITYDPSNDPQAIAEAEARDGENLAVGEDMAKEQSELLAGKYKDAEELERAYIELQKKMGEGESPEPESTDEPQSVSDTYNEDGSVNYSTAKERYGEELGDIFEASDIDPWKMNETFMEKGTLDEVQFKDLEDAGIPRHAVESYLSGLYNSTWGSQPETLTERDVAEMYDLAGGKATYDSMTEWAATNLSQEDIKAFDEVTNTGNKAAVRFAVKALMGQFEDAQGKTPELITGKNARAGSTYRSMAEVVRDMESPKYEKDEAYRFDVQRKLERSNLKV